MVKEQIKQQLPQLHLIRALASLGVTIFHLGGKKLFILNYGWLGVEMFFVLTGFIICWSLPNDYSYQYLPKFLLKRFVRIGPPYVISIIIVILVSVIVFHNTKKINSENILLHLVFLNNFFNYEYLSPVYWTLGIEFQFYILIGLLFPILNKSKIHAISIIFLLNIIAIYYKPPLGNFFNYIPFFSIGILTFLLKNNKIKHFEYVLIITLCSSILYHYNGLEQLVVSILTSLIILYFNSTNKYIDFFSKISFSLYLTHDVIGTTIIIFLGNLFQIKNVYTKAFTFSIGFMAAIIFAYLFYIFVEKKCIEYSKKLIYSFT